MLEPVDIFPREDANAASLYYDPDVHLVANTIDNGIFHSAWMSAEYAVNLLERGSLEELERAQAVIGAVLGCQDMDPRSPHYGNFKWEHEDQAVEDLNAVQFVLLRLIPLMLRHSDSLSEDLVLLVRERIRIALDEVVRIDVSPIYSNIVAQDIANSILGGQLLQLPRYTGRGVEKLRAWLNIIDQSGIPHEYNSPTYSFVTIEALHKIVAYSNRADACALAQLIASRIGLSVALRLHPVTGRLAPPHCRAYFPDLICGRTAEASTLSRAVAEGKIPNWLETVLRHRPLPMMVTETSDARAGTVISSYLDSAFSIGLASQELATQSNRFISNQSNVFAIHFSRKNHPRPGVVFSRYLINDKWLGDYRTTPSRSNDQVFRDEGSFRGVLAGPRAFGLYTSREVDAWSRCFSAKAVLIWNRIEDVDEIWLDGSPIGDLPAEVPEGSVILVACGDIFVVVRPLDRARLGSHSPIRIVEHRGCLVLEIYNYLGPAKTFWELANPGAFFQGYLRNGFYAEVLTRSRYSGAREAYEAFASGELSEDLDPALTFDGGNLRKWSLAYSRDDDALGIEVDLMRWQILRRWTAEGGIGLPMLTSPLALENRTGRIEVGGARLRCGKEAAWLVGIADAELWVAAYHGPTAAPLTLEVPAGQVHIENLDAGTVLWDKGRVTIDAIGLRGEPDARGAKTVDVVRR